MFRSRSIAMSAAALAVVGSCAIAAGAPASSAAPQGSTSGQVTSSAAARAGNYASHVFGSFGRAGTVRGHFVPERSFVRNGTTVVQGNLTATLRRGTGALVGRVHRHDVTLPVRAPGAHTATSAAGSEAAAAAAACSILHLVLGPLNLNLLGLVVTLNQVHLVINAVPGAGNLLGNLLCAVVNLLNGTGTGGLTSLSALLNEILAALGL
jgi:hypothetical protein